MKKLVFTLSIAMIIVCVIFISYSQTYKIEDNKKQLEDNIKQLVNTHTLITNSIDIKQELNIGNKKYILFTFNNSLGDVDLTKGLNSKYKIESMGYGSGAFSYNVYKTNKGQRNIYKINNEKYLILKGKNNNMQIEYAKVLLDNKEYKISIPKQEYFLSYCSVPNETQSVYLDVKTIKLFNNNDVDITNEMPKALLP